MEMFPEIKEAKVFLDDLMSRVQANTSQEGSAVAVPAPATTGRKQTATGTDISPHRPVWTRSYLRKQCTNDNSGLEAAADS
jgi:hypothetical protein